MTPPVVLGGEREALARVVHDLRSPLTVIRGLLFTLQREDPEPRRRRHLELIDGEVDRLTRGLEALLAPPSPATAVGCLAAAAAAAVERHRPAAAARGVAVTARARSAAAPVRADLDALARILDNLIGNAVRHSPPGGEVRLTLRCGARSASLTVRDQGAGVPAEDRQRIFTAGERGTAPRGSGRGLGLAICRELAHRHGGRLELASAGPGAAFRLTLPRADAAAPGPREAA